MKKLITLLMVVGMVVSLGACAKKNDSQVVNSASITTVDDGYEWYYDYQKKLDKGYSDAGWMVLQPGVYIDPITHQVDVWGGDSGIFYNVAMPGVFDTEVWEIYYNDYNYDLVNVPYDTDEFIDIQNRALEAWEAYRNGEKFDMTEDSYNLWYWENASTYDVWAWAQKYQR